MSALLYCKKCDKVFDKECIICSYCGGELENRKDKNLIGFREGLLKFREHFIDVFSIVALTMFALWWAGYIREMNIPQVLANFFGILGLYNILEPCHTKDEVIFCSGFSNLCFMICIVCCIFFSKFN